MIGDGAKALSWMCATGRAVRYCLWRSEFTIACDTRGGRHSRSTDGTEETLHLASSVRTRRPLPHFARDSQVISAHEFRGPERQLLALVLPQSMTALSPTYTDPVNLRQSVQSACQSLHHRPRPELGNGLECEAIDGLMASGTIQPRNDRRLTP